MKINVSFYFREVDSAVECTSILDDNIMGLGRTNYEAMTDYSEKYNEWSRKLTEETKKILDGKKVQYTIKEFKLIPDIN